MPSSPTRSTQVAATRRQVLIEVLSQLPDPRDPRGVRHSVAAVLGVGIAAVLAGARSFTAIGEWAAGAGHEVLAGLGVTGRAPNEATIRRVFARVDADLLDRVLGAWAWTSTTTVTGRRVIAIDGKALRGAAAARGVMPHLVAALDHGTATVLGQVAVTAKSNEIPALRTLLGRFDLTGAVVTVDAMHTQRDTATAITAGGGDYVFTVKANQRGLHTKITALPWKNIPAHRVTSSGPLTVRLW